MAGNRPMLVLLFVLASLPAFTQVNRYMVFFKDKSGSPYSLNSPETFLSPRAIDRRIIQGIDIAEEDLPVNANYIAGVASAGATTFFQTRWMNGVLVQCNASLVPSLRQMGYVDRVELVAPSVRLQQNGRRAKSNRSKGRSAEIRTASQLELIGLTDMQQAGYRGEEIQMAIFDSGFPGVSTAQPFQHIFREGRIDPALCRDFVTNSGNVFQFDEHGTEVFSVIAAYEQGNFAGGAYGARYHLYVTEDVASEYRIEEYNWLFAAEHADSLGVDVINSSLGYYDFDDPSMNYSQAEMDGQTAVVTRAARFAADRGIIVVCSAGNEGNIAWQIITAPADAVNVLAIASVNTSGIRAGSSSKGPSADGRIKPDVAAMGVNTSVIEPNGANGSASGTSLASPLVASLAAGVLQRYPDLTNLEIMDAIRKSASQAGNPDNLIGYGIPNFKAVVSYLEAQNQENLFDVFPNPVVADSFSIRPNDPNVITSCRMDIISSLGQVVVSKDIAFSWLNRTYTHHLYGVAPGLYIVRIRWADRKYTYRLVKAS